MIAKLPPTIEPMLAKQDMRWADATSALEAMQRIEELEAANDDPEALLQSLIENRGLRVG